MREERLRPGLRRTRGPVRPQRVAFLRNRLLDLCLEIGCERHQLGIAGTPNRSGNDGTITRFGWKAQNKSLEMFAGEAANVEMGVTNEDFPNEKTWGNGSLCITTNNYPEDQTLVVNPTPGDASNSSQSSVVR